MPARKLQQAPQTVTYRGVEYRLAVAPPPRVVTYAGEQYHLAESLEREPQPTVPPLESSELVEQEDAPKVGLDVEIVSDDDDDEEEYYEPNPPLDRNVYVRLSQDDFHLLSSLPDAEYGMLQDFLSRARNKKMTSGRTEVMASENEVRAAIAALQAFISAEDASPSAITHAQDMASSWGRNYLSPEKPLPKRLPNYNLDTLPRSQNIRTFNYKGARYVLVEGAEEVPDYLKKRETPTYPDVINNEIYSRLITNIDLTVEENIPISQIKRTIDAIDQGAQSIVASSYYLNKNNDTDPSARWLTDALFFGKASKKKLERLITEPETVRTAVNFFIHGIQKAQAGAQAVLKATEDASSMIEERGWASKWAMKKSRNELKKDILREFYGMDEGEVRNFLKEAYNTPDPSSRTVKETQETPTSESPKREESK